MQPQKNQTIVAHNWHTPGTLSYALKTIVSRAIIDGFGTEHGIEAQQIHLEKPTEKNYGDYSTNSPLILAKPLKTRPIEIAESLKNQLEKYIKEQQTISLMSNSNEKKDNTVLLSDVLESVEVAPPGFLNLRLKPQFLITQVSKLLESGEDRQDGIISIVGAGSSRPIHSTGLPQKGKKIMVEFAHPNTHKAFHIGHLRNITTGESMVRLMQAVGYEVVRANYQGDVGMHIAKCLYAITTIEEFRTGMDTARNGDIHQKVEYLGKAYAAGSAAYESEEEAKKQTGEINKQIYQRDASVFDLYTETREWSLEYFQHIYDRVNTYFDRLYFESEAYQIGKQTVEEAVIRGIFEKSDGAIIFPGEKYGLHSRVFITSEGNPTYEGKDIGLAQIQFKEYNPEQIIHVVASEQQEYFKVIIKALEVVFPELTGREYHLSYGWVKLKHGKMSSRSGNVVLGEWLLDEAKMRVVEIMNIAKKARENDDGQKEVDQERSESIQIHQNLVAEAVAIAAVKYSMLRVQTKAEIAFDMEESVSFDGDSGPYLMYTYARCKSVMRRSQELGIRNLEKEVYKNFSSDTRLLSPDSNNLNPEELDLLRSLYRLPEVVVEAASHLSPNILCTYLFDVAQTYNTFYNKHTILGNQSHSKGSLDINRERTKQSGTDAIIASRLFLTYATAQVIQQGLYLLGISTVERM